MVELLDVSHSFAAGQPLFRELNCQFEPGVRYAVTGASGSGKSTLLSILAGWTVPSNGKVHRTNLRAIGWVFQNPHGSPRRTALDHVALPFLAQGFTRAQANARAVVLLESFKLADRSEVTFRHLSGGESQRLMLARAVAAAPTLLLVDEPTAQLDARSADTVNLALQNVSLAGGIVVIATHDLRTAAACDVRIDLSL